MYNIKFLLINNFCLKIKRYLTKIQKFKIFICILIYLVKFKDKIDGNDEIEFNKISNYSMYDEAKKSYEFLILSSNGLLLSNYSNKGYIYPKVSVVVPVYNSQKYIQQAITSIQNQEMLELDIIIVNDFSTDNTSKIIDQIKKNDKRIRVLNNKKNMGILYTRCIGTLIAKGKFIFPLDNDDMFLDKDKINKIYHLAIRKKNDIVVFNAIMVHQFENIINFTNLIPIRGHIEKNIMINQPELSSKASIIIWGQCIRAKIYKTAINIYGEKRYSKYLLYYEDAIINHIIYQIAKSCSYIQNYGILYLFKIESASNKITERERNISYMKYIEIMLDFSRNTLELKNKIVSTIIYLFKIGNFDIYYLNDKIFKQELNILLRKIVSSKLLSFENKSEIMKSIHIIIELETRFCSSSFS